MDLQQMVGREVETPAGEYVGMAESTRYITPDGGSYPVPPGGGFTPVLMVRHLAGDGAVQPYEAHEVRPRRAEGAPAIAWYPDGPAETLQSLLQHLSGTAAWDYVMGELADGDPGQYRTAMAVLGSGHLQASA